MKKALGLVLLATFFIGAVSAWTYVTQESRHRKELERLTRPRTLARLTVLAREKTPEGDWRTTVELEGFEALLTDSSEGEPEAPEPGSAYNLILDSDGNLRLLPPQDESDSSDPT